MKKLEFAKDFATDMKYRFPSTSVKRLETLVLVLTPQEAVEVSSQRDVVTIKHAYSGKLNTYTTDWNKCFKSNMVALSVDTVAELLGLITE